MKTRLLSFRKSNVSLPSENYFVNVNVVKA